MKMELGKLFHLFRNIIMSLQPKASIIDSMVNAGIRTNDAFSYLAEEVGDIKNAGFTKRDCYNYMSKQKMMVISAGDSQDFEKKLLRSIATMWKEVVSSASFSKFEIYEEGEIAGSLISEKDSKVVWCNSLIRIASNSIYKGFDTEVARNICKKKILELEEEIEIEIKKNKLEEEIDLRGKEVNQENDSNITPVLDSPQAKPKGLSNSRLKYHFEKCKVKSIKKATTPGNAVQS
ncbi:hypothetical protein FEM48_Zijuj11G0040900 [Ziziphus jujuba var. spinosa]|uniref:Uncharacterized protein n=1 Tax=Ziziphus jujuba var. spinosa TaxID=714518 RepID=A0A978UGQ6_ZIZJJ|nr:hypothetical protein FEM48_Zijuj11G0040900 [Ziziphus jujuba var. spinosa]